MPVQQVVIKTIKRIFILICQNSREDFFQVIKFCVFGFSENLIRIAFQCLQLVITDFLPVMPWRCLPLCVDTVAKFGSQTQELNISLTAVGLMVRSTRGLNASLMLINCSGTFRIISIKTKAS
jgi:hypothetical protein